MFSKTSYEKSMWDEMELNLKKNTLDQSSQYDKYKLKALNLLADAVKELDNLGLHKQASDFLETLEKAEKDPVVKVTPEQSVEKLKTRGWPFNAADDCEVNETSDDVQYADEDLSLEGVDVPALEVSEGGNDMSLCESELKQLRNIWK